MPVALDISWKIHQNKIIRNRLETLQREIKKNYADISGIIGSGRAEDQ